jgi:hypothetical protein
MQVPEEVRKQLVTRTVLLKINLKNRIDDMQWLMRTLIDSSNHIYPASLTNLDDTLKTSRTELFIEK